jgi:hypothetical protein
MGMRLFDVGIKHEQANDRLARRGEKTGFEIV